MKHLKKGNFIFIFNGIKKRVLSKNEAYGLRRDLTQPFENPKALIQIHIRPVEKGDNTFFSSDNFNIGILSAKLQTCYIATDDGGTPCYRQWLMASGENSKIERFWKGLFPILKSDEALLENAFTIPDFRGKRVMPAAMALIAEKGHKLGARYILTFVDINNIPSLKGCKRSGFSPYTLRTEKWFLFNRTITFSELTQENANHFIQQTS
ncbi:MAG: N-acetyltransferase [Bacteroidota bacterium]